jgi:hypothetical protein
MPTGQFTSADLQTPPPVLGRFTFADLDQPPVTMGVKRGGSTVTDIPPLHGSDISMGIPGAAEKAMGAGRSPSEILLDSARGPAMGAAVVAPMLTGGASLPIQAAVSGASGAAQSKLTGGSNTQTGISAVLGAALPYVGAATGKVIGRVADYFTEHPELEEAIFPEKPPAEVLQAHGLAKGGASVPDRAAGLGAIPNRYVPPPATEVAASQPSAATAPKPGVSVWRDATRQNVPYAGEDDAQLRTFTQAAVNKAVPPEGNTLALNKRVQAQVDLHLSQGDVPAAESVLDDVAQAVNPKWQPPDRPRIVPSVQNIRERIAQVNAAEAQPSRITPDAMEDKALQQEMNWDLERHGWAAESEARREFIARNSTGVTKADLTGAAEKPVRYTKTPGVSATGSAAPMAPTDVDDLMGKMQQMLEAAKKSRVLGDLK